MSKKIKELAKGLVRRRTAGREDALFQGSTSNLSRRKAFMEVIGPAQFSGQVIAFQRDEVTNIIIIVVIDLYLECND
jgi:hypothetical protein